MTEGISDTKSTTVTITASLATEIASSFLGKAGVEVEGSWSVSKLLQSLQCNLQNLVLWSNIIAQTRTLYSRCYAYG